MLYVEEYDLMLYVVEYDVMLRCTIDTFGSTRVFSDLGCFIRALTEDKYANDSENGSSKTSIEPMSAV